MSLKTSTNLLYFSPSNFVLTS